MEKVHTMPNQAVPTYEELLERFEASQAELAATQTELTATKKELATTQKKLATSERQRERADAKAEREQSLRIANGRELTSTKREAERYKRENISLQKRLKNAGAAMDKMAKELESCKGLCAELDAKVQKCTEDLKKAQEAAERYKKYGTQTAKHLERNEATISELKGIRQGFKSEIKRLTKQNGEQVVQIKNLVRQLDSTTRKIHRLQVSQARNFENSGIPSSKCPNKPVNTRVHTGRKPGAQEKHEFHGRKPFEGSFVETYDLPTPEKFLDTNRYAPTEKYKVHQRVGITWVPQCTAVRAQGFRNLRTNQVEYPVFPPGYYNDVSYDGGLKALLFELTHRCNVSIGHARQFLLDMTGNTIDVSTGCICGLAHEFASRTKEERKAIFDAIASSRVVQGDFTFGRLNGKQVAILISATPDGDVLFQAKAKKGLAGLDGSPLKFDPDAEFPSEKVIVSDHESTFAGGHCGILHQECLAHIIRALIEIIQQEPTMTWAKEMLEWIKEAIHFRNQVLDFEVEYTAEAVQERMDSFHSILEKARKEYAGFPGGRPKAGYRNGVNLLKRLREHPDEYTLFLFDLTVPPTNSFCEQLARMFKRKASQVMTFRSMGGVMDWCDSESVFLKILSEGLDLYVTMASVFEESSFAGCSTQRKPRGLNKCHTEAIRKAMELDDETAGNSDTERTDESDPSALEATA